MPRLGRPRSWMRIPAPVALVGERVEVRNRRLRAQSWELGEVRTLSWIPPQPSRRADGTPDVIPGYWRYDVRLERRRRTDGFALKIPLTVTVSIQDWIRRVA